MHELFTDGIMIDTYYYFLGQETEPNDALLYVFLIYTPVIIIASWILTIAVDEPSKDWANELDVQSRLNRPAPRNKELTAEEVEEYYTGWSFTKRSWKVLAFVVWLLLLVITTETY